MSERLSRLAWAQRRRTFKGRTLLYECRLMFKSQPAPETGHTRA